ncbi:MAG: M42 family metallopeptidase [Promethearchaeota archaeon]
MKIERKIDEQFLEQLVNTPGLSGYEQKVQRLFRKKIRPFVQNLETDVMGNVFATLNPSGSPKIMLAAHCDETGMMVKYISKEGFIYFHSIGLDAHLIPGSRVQILTKNGPILGIVGKKAIHLQDSDERSNIIPIKDQYIDIGARSRAESENLGIKIGDPILFDYYYSQLGANGDVTGRCFDDRIGVLIIYEILKRLAQDPPKAQVVGVSTTQEEVGLRGATTAAYKVEPDISLVYDVDFSMDSPDSDEKGHGIAKLGEGPIISIGPMDHKVVDLLIETAADLKIPIQRIAEPRNSGTDGDVIQITKSGVVIGVIGIPCRNMHSYSEIVNLNDVEAIIKLSVEFIKRIEPNFKNLP